MLTFSRARYCSEACFRIASRGHRHWCASRAVTHAPPPSPTNEIAPVNDNEMTPADEMV
jgi:hypothetical protein